MLWQPTRGIIQPNQHWRRPQDAGGGGGTALFTGGAFVLANGYSGGNKTWSANGGSNLPPCLFLCGFTTTDAISPTVRQIGATPLTLVANASSIVQIWAADYVGGSDTITFGDGAAHNAMGVAAAWATGAPLAATAQSAQSAAYGSAVANPTTPLTLSSACVIPAGGIGFVVGSSMHTSLSDNSKGWAGVDVSPIPNDGFTLGKGRLSIAVRSTPGSWSPQFWGELDANSFGYNFASGMAAIAFG